LEKWKNWKIGKNKREESKTPTGAEFLELEKNPKKTGDGYNLVIMEDKKDKGPEGWGRNQ